jgi:hypothetical protein
MPSEIEEFVQEKAAGSASTDHTKSIRERLKEIMNLFKVSRYRPSLNGSLLIDDEQLIRGGNTGSHKENKPFGARKRSGRVGGTGGNVYSAFQKKDGVTGQKVNPDIFPTVRWVTLADGTRVPGDIEDRAARYLADQNLLLINSDFRVFTDMIEFFVNEFGNQPGIKGTVEDSVHGWFEQALVETVIGAQALQGSKEWTIQDVDSALSEEALTTAVMQRYHVNIAVKRDLGSRLGSLRAMKVA